MAHFIQLTTGAAVKFPFELKDAFRAAFPSAKWNAYDKRWEVGARSVKRLERWIAEVEKSGVESEIAARDEADLSAREIEQLTADLARIAAQAAAARQAKEEADEARARAEELRARLAAAQADLDAAKAEAAAAEAAAEAVAADIDARVSHITTRNEIDFIRGRMAQEWRTLKSANKDRFEGMQEELLVKHRALKDIGVKCPALILAINANWNRRDRDLADLRGPIEFVAIEVDEGDE